MAEVRKKVIEDKYDTAKIKKKEVTKDKKVKENKSDKKASDSREKKGLFTRFMIFCHGVKGEFDKVHWTKKSDMIKYSIATVITIIFCSIFFYVIDVLFALVQSLFA